MKKIISILFLFMFLGVLNAATNVFIDPSENKPTILIGDVVNTVNGETGDVVLDSTTLSGVAFLASTQTFTGENTFAEKITGTELVVSTFQMTTGAGASKILTSDTSGYATWQDLTAFTNPATENLDMNGFDIESANVITATTSMITPEVKALDVNGTKFTDDGGNVALFVEDGGYVGVNTEFPDYPLHIKTTSNVGLKLETSSTNGAFSLYQNTSSGSKTWAMLVAGTATSGFTVGTLGFYNDTDGISALSILPTGEVGIGTTSPFAKLSVENIDKSHTSINTNLPILNFPAATNISGIITSDASNSGANNVYGNQINGIMNTGLNYASTGMSISSVTAAGDAIGMFISGIKNSATVGTRDAYGVIIDSVTVSSDTQTAHGLYIDNIDNPFDSTKEHSIYVASDAPSYFNGDVGIGTDAPSTKFHINGTYADTASSTQVLYSTDTISDNSSFVVIVSSGGAVALSSDPQIADGVTGQVIEIWGTSDTNTITLADGSGLKLNNDTSFTIGIDDVISFKYVNAEWCERFRSNN